MNTKLQLHRMGLGDILAEGFRLFCVNFALITLFIFCVSGPLALLYALVPTAYLTEMYGKTTVTILDFGVSWLDYLVSLVLMIGFTYIAEKSVLGEIPTFVNTLKFCFSRLIDVLLTSLLLTVVLILFALPFVIPAIIWANYYSFYLTIATLRNLRGKAALNDSKKLVQGQWWRIFSIEFMLLILML